MAVRCGVIYNKTSKSPIKQQQWKGQSVTVEVGSSLVSHQHPLTHPFKSNARMRMCCNTSSEVIWGSTAKERNSGGKKLSHFWGEKTQGRPSGVISPCWSRGSKRRQGQRCGGGQIKVGILDYGFCSEAVALGGFWAGEECGLTLDLQDPLASLLGTECGVQGRKQQSSEEEATAMVQTPNLSSIFPQRWLSGSPCPVWPLLNSSSMLRPI